MCKAMHKRPVNGLQAAYWYLKDINDAASAKSKWRHTQVMPQALHTHT